MKGIAVLSETLLTAISLVISFILIILIVNMVFSIQTSRTYSELFKSIARDIGVGIDRAAAMAGSGMVEVDIPKGLKMNVTVDYKTTFINYGDKTVQSSFSGLTHGGPYNFINPEKLCIVKTRDDRRVNIVAKSCSCDPSDDVCDPECGVEGICDTRCYTNVKNDVCSKICVKEGDEICDPDCYRNEDDGVFDKDCIDPDKNPDETCDPDSDGISDNVCDIDCYLMYSNGTTGVCDPDCPPEDKISVVGGEKVKSSDGNCYTGCANYTGTGGILILKRDGICDLDCNEENKICDPDCTKDPDCEFKCANIGENCTTLPPCPTSGGVCCPGTKIVSLECCGNGVCETRDMWNPEYKKRWENNYTCPIDCCPPGTTCPTRPPDCEARVNKGSFTASPCYFDTVGGGTDIPYWGDGVIEVCHEEVQKFLDRRNWSILEVAETIKSPPPEGWAFDYSRYHTIRTGPDTCSELKSSVTIRANEEYTRSDSACCADSGNCPCAMCDYMGPECNGVGFCGDHATAMVSILRTLGNETTAIPASDVWASFMNDPRPGRHAFNVLRCNSTIPDLMPEECQGHWGEWIRIDATQHIIQPLADTPCSDMCIWWNDQGPYPLTDGRINATHGRPYPPDARCNQIGSTTLDCKYDILCKDLLGVECVK